VTAVTRNNGSDPGFVCVNTSVPVNVAVASAETQFVGSPSVIANVFVPIESGCPAGSDAFVQLRRDTGTTDDTAFYVIFN